MHEQHAGVGLARGRLGQQRAVHVDVAARLKDQRLAEVIEPLLRPGALFQHGAAIRRGQPVNDQAQRLSGRVRVDGANPMNHVRQRVT